MNINNLINLKEEIEKMDIINQKEILKILYSNKDSNETLNETTNETINETLNEISNETTNETPNETLNSNSFIISENNNGTFVNLSELDNTVIIKLQEYIQYFYEQQKNLSNIEEEKINIKKEFFDSKIKKISNIDNNEKVNNKNKKKTKIYNEL